MSDIAKELFKSIVTDTASQEDFGSAIKQKMDQALDVRKAGITAGIYNKQSASSETFEESVDLEEAKMSPKDAEIAQEIIRSEDEKVSVAYGQKLKVARQKLIKKYGKGWAKMVESDLEEAKIPSSNISIFSDPKLAKSAASKQKYKTQVFVGDDGKFLVPSTNKEAGQLKKDGHEVYESTDLEEASSGDIAKLLKFVAKNGAKVKGNVADFGGSKIEFSFDKGKIKFDGGKDSGVEYFDNLRDAISTLSIGMED